MHYSLYHDARAEHLPDQSLDAVVADDWSYPQGFAFQLN